MNRAISGSFLALALGLTACAGATSPAPVKHATPSIFDVKAVAQYAFGGKSAHGTPFDPRKPGDFAVFRVSGSFQPEPMTLTERVAAREGAMLVMDYEIVKASGTRESLRVGMDLVAARADTVFGVARVPAASADRKALETLMNKTLVTMEIFDEVFKTPSIACDVGGKKIECETTTYRVVVMNGTSSAREGTLTITTSDEFPWGSLDAEVIADDFEVLYRRELAEIGASDPSKPIFVATNTLDLY
jgi:hypothetical protein